MIWQFRKLWATPSAETIALRELEQSRRELLVAHDQHELGLRMVDFHKAKIKRLTLFLKGAMQGEPS